VNKQGFTMIELLLVLSILSVLGLMTFSLKTPMVISHALIIDQVINQIEKARSNAYLHENSISLLFEKNTIYSNQEMVFYHSDSYFVNNEILINAKGHIINPTTIYFSIQQQDYQLVINLGYGAYRVEKT